MSGRYLLVELGIELETGAGRRRTRLLAPDNRRTATLECIEAGKVLAITYEQVEQLYYQNPTFGFYFLRLSTERLFDNIQTLEAELELRRRVEAWRSASLILASLSADSQFGQAALSRDFLLISSRTFATHHRPLSVQKIPNASMNPRSPFAEILSAREVSNARDPAQIEAAVGQRRAEGARRGAADARSSPGTACRTCGGPLWRLRRLMPNPAKNFSPARVTMPPSSVSTTCLRCVSASVSATPRRPAIWS